MSQKTQFKELAQRAYRSYHQDGIIDILIGIGIIGFSMVMLTDNVFLSSLSWLPILFYMPLKKRITIPRFGYVQFTSEQAQSQKLVFKFAFGLLIFSLFLGLYFLFTSGNMPTGVAEWLQNNIILIPIGLITLFLVVAGMLTGLNRFFAYAGLILLILTGTILLNTPVPYSILLLGSVMVLVGLWLLLQFLRKYSEDGGEGNHAAI